MVCTNVPGNEQELSNTKNVFGKNKKSLKCRRMNGKTGIVEEVEFATRAVAWHGCNFGMHKVADPIKDRNVCKSANVTKNNIRNIHALAQQSETEENKLKLEDAHNENRLRFVVFNAYDVLLTLTSKETDNKLFLGFVIWSSV